MQLVIGSWVSKKTSRDRTRTTPRPSKPLPPGEAQVGFVNHYYVYRLLSEDPNLKARNYHPRGGGPGAMINIAGAGTLKTSKKPGSCRGST